MRNGISIVKKSQNFTWIEISKDYTKTNKDIYVCVDFKIPPHNLQYFNDELFKELERANALFPLMDLYFLWAHLIREQENIRIAFVERYSK